MTTTSAIQRQIKGIPIGKPFANKLFLKHGSRASVDQALSRLVKSEKLERITNGVYVRPKINRYVGVVMPALSEVAEVIAKSNGETIQVHGAEAARQFNLTTQVPAKLVFYTSGSTREVTVGKLKLGFIRAARRKLQFSGTRIGLALSALWFLGKEGINESAVKMVCSKLEVNELNQLRNAELPAWLAEHLNQYHGKEQHG
jgi:hypothetical protein